MLEEFTLLYVEDNKDSQRAMKELLKNEVKELYQAYDGKEGFTLFLEKEPDIIITDINMPLESGLEMSKKIKEVSPDQIIILLTSLSDINVIKEAIDINIDGYINKPILDIYNFLEKVHSKITLLEYKKLKMKEEKIKDLLNLIHEVSHHWKQPLNVISLISSEYLFKYENSIPIEDKDIKNFEIIIEMVDKLSNILEQIENRTTQEIELEKLLDIIQIGNPIYENISLRK